eukprot:CAMPEP_0170733730 /NCGR_PEP_ID=MMETSP0437-20130122/2224_1 /TAXON_ID=0 /ORGANISM="Sexangularia sp." /LENGTH=143 /DNA_ID=CAMNT_0011072019 /DNA_START=523 /DNA_END=951 /DNA_ORIENTATION=+
MACCYNMAGVYLLFANAAHRAAELRASLNLTMPLTVNLHNATREVLDALGPAGAGKLTKGELWSLLGCATLTAVSLSLALAIGALAFAQLRALSKGTTSLEVTEAAWIEQRAREARQNKEGDNGDELQLSHWPYDQGSPIANL